MEIKIRSTPQSEIRSKQSGDWWYSDNSIRVNVLDSMPPESQLAVAVHELVEAYLCRTNGITDQVVCAFDDQYEKERDEGKHGPAEEPGDDPRSPYLNEHRAATRVERAVCQALEVSWTEHEENIMNSAHEQPAPELEEDHPKSESLAAPLQQSLQEPPKHVPD